MRFVLFALLALGSCADATRTAPGPEQPDVLPYRLDAPDAVIALSGELTETSALTVLPPDLAEAKPFPKP